MKKKSESPSKKSNPENALHEKVFIEICFDYKTNLFLAFLILYLLITTCCNINGSSVGMWNSYFNQNPDPQIIFGTSKAIRSDEWLMHTPALLSQCNNKNNFPIENYSLGGFKAPLVMNVPVKHFSILLRPQYWLFFFADSERAFAFYWNMKFVLLVGGMFLLLMMLLENNFILSVFGALWTYFSGYLQWWYSSPQMWPELVGCFALFTTAFIHSIISKRTTVVLLSCVVFLISFFNFVITLYPSHQVPLIYLSCCIVLSVLLPMVRTVYELIMNRFRLICVILTLILIAGLLFLFYCDVRQTLEAFANTVYPGARRFTGGQISIAKIFNGFWGIFMSQENFPKVWDNVCESSNFLLFFPIPMMIMYWKLMKRKEISSLDIGFATYITIILIWLMWGFPKLIAQLTLFDRVSESRALLSLGIASILWTCLFLHQITKEKVLFTLTLKSSVTAMTLVGILYYSYYFNIATDGFASVSQIIMVCVFVTAASILLVSGKTLLFISLIIIPNIIANSMINPICIGLKPLLNQPFYVKINQIVRQEPDSKWVIYGDRSHILASIASAAGAQTFNSLKYIPNLDEMKVLSSKNSDVRIYNRHGYITLLPDKGSEIDFRLSNTEDHYMILVNPGNACWKQLGITHCLLSSKEGIYIFKYQKNP